MTTHQRGENGSHTGVGLGVKGKVRNGDGDQPWTISSVAAKGNRGKEMEVVGLLKVGDTWAYLNDDRNDSVEIEKLKQERKGIIGV